MSNPTREHQAAGAEGGFDRHDPNARFIALLGFGLLVALVAILLGLQYYHDRVRERQVFVQVLEPESQALKDLRAREDRELHSYQYLDRAKGTVRLPVERAMELLVKEAAADRLFYPTQPTPVVPTEAAQGGANAAPK